VQAVDVVEKVGQVVAHELEQVPVRLHSTTITERASTKAAEVIWAKKDCGHDAGERRVMCDVRSCYECRP
jgi:hypothetical protein